MDYTRHAAEIAGACESVFGRQIDVKPRALHALVEAYSEVRLLGHQIARSSDLELFRQVLIASPACADALLRQDKNLMPVLSELKRRDGKAPERRLGTYERLLREVFESKWPFRSGHNDSGIRVKLTGVLTEGDIFSGCLQAGRFSLLPNETAKALLSAVGLIEDGYADPRGDDFLADLEAECSPLLSIDSSHSEQQLLLFLDEKQKLRLTAFGATSLGLLEEQLAQSGPFVFRGGVLQPAEKHSLFAEEAISELEDLINTPGVLESGFQRFFQAHPEFLKALDFSRVHPQPILYKDDGSTLIPDFFLEKIDSGWHAIADLKRPYDQMVVRRKNRTYFAQWVQDAIAQLHYYKEWFDDSRNRRMFEQAQGISNNVYRPRMVLVAGRSAHFTDDVERIRLLSSTDQTLSLWTYDDVLNRAKRYREFASGGLSLKSDRRGVVGGKSITPELDADDSTNGEPNPTKQHPVILKSARARAPSQLVASLEDAVLNHKTGEGVIQTLSNLLADPIGLRDSQVRLAQHQRHLVVWTREFISECTPSNAGQLSTSTQDLLKIQEAVEAATLLAARIVGGSASRIAALLQELYTTDTVDGKVVLDSLRICAGFPNIDFSGLILRGSMFRGYSKFLSCKCSDAKFVNCHFVECLNPRVAKSGFVKEMFDSSCSLGDLEVFFEKRHTSDQEVFDHGTSEIRRFLRSFLKGDRFLVRTRKQISFSTSLSGLSEHELQRMIVADYLYLSQRRRGLDCFEISERFKPSVWSFIRDHKVDELMKEFFESAVERRRFQVKKK